MAAEKFTLKLELSPFASETLRALVAELCALRDELERLSPESGGLIGQAIAASLKRIEMLGGMFAHDDD